MTKPHYIGLLLLLLLPLTAYAQSVTVIEPSDKKLVIKGLIGDDTTFIGNIGVVLEGAPNPSPTPLKLTIYPYALTMVSGTGETLRPAAVPAELMLTPNAPSTFQVKVTGVKEPGEYSGKISLSLPGQQQKDAVVVDLTVMASVRPALSMITENDRLQANLVNCTNCPLARLLLSRAAFQNEMQLGFEKPVGAPLAINNSAIAVKGEQNKFQLNDQHLKISLDKLAQSQPGQKYLPVPVTIAKDDLPADHYVGSIYLSVPGQTNELKVPVDFNVRIAPLWALLILLVGIILGRLFKFMQDKGNAIADALESINRLEFRLQNVNPEDADIIRPMLGEARELVNEDKVTEAGAAVNAISSRLAALNELRQIQARLAGKQDPALAPILTKISQAREHLRFKQDESAKVLIKEIKDALVALAKTPGLIDSDATDLDDAADRADSASAAIAGLGTVTRQTVDRLRDGLVVISGLSNQFRNEATLFIVRPLLWIALLIGLLAMGMKILYVDNPTFGANPFTDFLGLVFWGLSAETAGRTLSGLSLTNPNRPAGR